MALYYSNSCLDYILSVSPLWLKRVLPESGVSIPRICQEGMTYFETVKGPLQ